MPVLPLLVTLFQLFANWKSWATSGKLCKYLSNAPSDKLFASIYLSSISLCPLFSHCIHRLQELILNVVKTSLSLVYLIPKNSTSSIWLVVASDLCNHSNAELEETSRDHLVGPSAWKEVNFQQMLVCWWQWTEFGRKCGLKILPSSWTSSFLSGRIFTGISWKSSSLHRHTVLRAQPQQRYSDKRPNNGQNSFTWHSCWTTPKTTPKPNPAPSPLSARSHFLQTSVPAWWRTRGRLQLLAACVNSPCPTLGGLSCRQPLSDQRKPIPVATQACGAARAAAAAPKCSFL